jgi:hypothetical protein
MYVKIEFVRLSDGLILFLVVINDDDNVSSDTLERLRNISKMFSGKDDEQQELKKVEKIVPSEKIKRTFRK